MISQFSLHSSQFPLPPFTIHHSQFTIPFCWDMDLAVKSPRAEILGSEMAVRRFLREAETWVQLGLHPHIASCYYVRNLGGIPRMFIEYADAGTLRDWLRDGKVKDWCAMRAKGKRRAGTWRVAEHEAESLDSLCNCYRLDPIERSLS